VGSLSSCRVLTVISGRGTCDLCRRRGGPCVVQEGAKACDACRTKRKSCQVDGVAINRPRGQAVGRKRKARVQEPEVVEGERERLRKRRRVQRVVEDSPEPEVNDADEETERGSEKGSLGERLGWLGRQVGSMQGVLLRIAEMMWEDREEKRAEVREWLKKGEDLLCNK